eukprot:861052_1
MESTLPQCFLGKDNLFEISTIHGMNSGTNDSCPVCRGTPRVGEVQTDDHCKDTKVGDLCDLQCAVGYISNDLSTTSVRSACRWERPTGESRYVTGLTTWDSEYECVKGCSGQKLLSLARQFL